MPHDPAPCCFNEPESRLPGLQPDTICPGRMLIELSWLFRIADYMPQHLPTAGGPMDQPALIMDAAEQVRIAEIEWEQHKHGADH